MLFKRHFVSYRKQFSGQGEKVQTSKWKVCQEMVTIQGEKTEKTQLLGYLMKEKTSFLCQNLLLQVYIRPLHTFPMLDSLTQRGHSPLTPQIHFFFSHSGQEEGRARSNIWTWYLSPPSEEHHVQLLMPNAEPNHMDYVRGYANPFKPVTCQNGFSAK